MVEYPMFLALTVVYLVAVAYVTVDVAARRSGVK